jgi:hypothetical protein
MSDSAWLDCGPPTTRQSIICTPDTLCPGPRNPRLPIYATLNLLEDSLTWFHVNKGVFVDLGIRTDLVFPKSTRFNTCNFNQVIRYG